MSDAEDSDISLFTSSESDEWSTPPSFLRPLADAFDGFDLDAASGAENSPIADQTLDVSDDGLATPWHGDVWINPPYSEIAEWTDKVVAENRRDAVDSITYLVKGDSSTDWWHAAAAAADVVAMIDRRLSFGEAGDAPFCSHLFLFGDVPDGVVEVLGRKWTVFTADHYVANTQQAALGEYTPDGGRSE